MVKKSSKAGLHTGNTIRLPGGHPFLQKVQNYSCVISEAKSMDKDQMKRFDDLTKYMPSADGVVEYSMNKKRRWELPHVIQCKLLEESDSPDLHMQVTEHTYHVGQAPDEHRKFCSAYYSNNGSVTVKVSHSEMNMKSAMQSYVETDHLDKKERREYRRLLRNSISSQDESDEEDDTPRYNCHIIRGAPTNGRLYKDLTTKGMLIASPKKPSTFGCCSKRNRFERLYEDCGLEYDEHLSDEEDPCVEGSSLRSLQSTSMTVQLQDCILPTDKGHRRDKAKLQKTGWVVAGMDEQSHR